MFFAKKQEKVNKKSMSHTFLSHSMRLVCLYICVCVKVLKCLPADDYEN